MDMELFKIDLKELFDKHSIILEKMDISSNGYESFTIPSNPQVLHINYYSLDIIGKFEETVLKY